VKRREFISLLGGVAAWPLGAPWQAIAYGACNTDRRARIAQVSFLGAAVAQTYHRAFRDGLSALLKKLEQVRARAVIDHLARHPAWIKALEATDFAERLDKLERMTKR
jgi:hypothetical protein